MVRGRTPSKRTAFNLVAFVVTTDEGLPHWAATVQPEHHTIIELCRRPRTVTEVAASMNLPVGVIRVLLGDLLEVGAIRVREPASADRPNVALIEEVLRGLRAL
ncbi:DUF742 domain-containing protein [Streptomyces sp. NPDC007856]|uniref:DUF742 domain-containing protein n=1 Tax=Streptomyces sp. NPDC007856 TaxID=3364781 RepID=UPI00369BAD14